MLEKFIPWDLSSKVKNRVRNVLWSNNFTPSPQQIIYRSDKAGDLRLVIITHDSSRTRCDLRTRLFGRCNQSQIDVWIHPVVCIAKMKEAALCY